MTEGATFHTAAHGRSQPPDNPINIRLKLLVIVVLFLATLGAGFLISNIVTEREARQAQVLAEFKQSWGPEQLPCSPSDGHKLAPAILA